MIGTFNENLLLNRLLYECKFNDGTTKEYAANTMASIYLWSWTRIDLAVPCFLTLLTINI